MKRHLLILACAMPLLAHAADSPDKSFHDQRPQEAASRKSMMPTARGTVRDRT